MPVEHNDKRQQSYWNLALTTNNETLNDPDRRPLKGCQTLFG